MRSLERQIVFTKYHVTCKVVAQESKETIARMERLLSSQRLRRDPSAQLYGLFFYARLGSTHKMGMHPRNVG